MHFDSQKIDMRPAPRYLGGCLPHAKSNFQHAWRFAPEMSAPVKRGKARGRAFCAVRLWMERRYKPWRERFKRTPLSVRQTSGARDKAAHAADLNFRGYAGWRPYEAFFISFCIFLGINLIKEIVNLF